VGNAIDKVSKPHGGLCLMGGASESDNAMKWFLERANGGDILVLRASGSDGYNDYLFSTLGVKVNSVETIVFHNKDASKEKYILDKIKNAEAIWFAGGDQWNYISYWRNTGVDSLINKIIKEKKIVLGGTSAGMAILGQYYFSAQYGTVTSEEALANPYDDRVTVDSLHFIKNHILKNIITDTHFDSRDRKGRLITFLSRIYKDYRVFCKAIACEDHTAVCIDENGIARVFGGQSSSEDYAYFIQINCEQDAVGPELCLPNVPLTWYKDKRALKALKVQGTLLGTHTFNINKWLADEKGEWLNWGISNGVLFEEEGIPIDCKK
jgi:cyanophycinase-like exopeptidase